MITAALLCALTCVSTFIIKIPTPTFGYIHPGDGFVLLCGLLLGPGWGALCAGLGSMLADLFGGYLIYAPATFLIKACSAFLCATLYGKLTKHKATSKTAIAVTVQRIPLAVGAFIGELFMILGYFVFEIFYLGISTGALSGTSLYAGVGAALSGVPFNLVQAVFGIILVFVLYPIIAPLYAKTLVERA